MTDLANFLIKDAKELAKDKDFYGTMGHFAIPGVSTIIEYYTVNPKAALCTAKIVSKPLSAIIDSDLTDKLDAVFEVVLPVLTAATLYSIQFIPHLDGLKKCFDRYLSKYSEKNETVSK